MENENSNPNEADLEALPATPDLMAPLSRELESVISKRNLLTCRTRKKVLEDLRGAAEEEEVIGKFTMLLSEIPFICFKYLVNCALIREFSNPFTF